MQNSSDRQREVIYNITYMHLAFCLRRGIACIYKNLTVACGGDCFPGVGEEESCAVRGEMSNLPTPLRAGALLTRATLHPCSGSAWWVQVGCAQWDQIGHWQMALWAL